MFAQALVEYGLVNAVASGIDAVWYRLEDWIQGMNPATGLIIGGVVFLWIVLRSFQQRRP